MYMSFESAFDWNRRHPPGTRVSLQLADGRRSSQQLPSSLWNRCVSFSTTFKQLDRYLPDSVPAFGAFVESGTTESSRVIADMLERMVTESLSRSPNEPQ